MAVNGLPIVLRNQIRGQRNLRNVEVIIVQHARPDFEMRQHEPVELEPFRLDGPIDQRMRSVVVAAGNGEIEVPCLAPTLTHNEFTIRITFEASRSLTRDFVPT